MNEQINWMDIEEEIYKLERIKDSLILMSMSFDSKGYANNEITGNAMMNVVDSLEMRINKLFKIAFNREREDR